MRKENKGTGQGGPASQLLREGMHDGDGPNLKTNQKKGHETGRDSTSISPEMKDERPGSGQSPEKNERDTPDEKNDGEGQGKRRDDRREQGKNGRRDDDSEDDAVGAAEASSGQVESIISESMAIMSVEEDLIALELRMSGQGDVEEQSGERADIYNHEVEEEFNALEMRHEAGSLERGHQRLSGHHRESPALLAEIEDIQPPLIQAREIYVNQNSEIQATQAVMASKAQVTAGAGSADGDSQQLMNAMFFESVLEESDLRKAFRLTSRAYQFITFIFEDLLKRKLRANGSKKEYFTQYVLLLLRISGEFTFSHSLRTQSLALNLARKAGISEKEVLEEIRLGALFCDIGELDERFAGSGEEDVKKIRQFLANQDFLMAGVLHDIGKIRIPKEILYKQGKLSDEEFKVMKMHPVYSEMILYPIEPLRHLCPVVRAHHEKWDGKGYPDGLSGAKIPVAARIIAIADVFDALVSDRPYKKGMPFPKARRILEEGRGTHFDPHLLDIFLSYITPLYEGL